MQITQHAIYQTADRGNAKNLGTPSLACYIASSTSSPSSTSRVPALARLDCYGNKLTELDLSNVPNLANLQCGYTKLTELDLSNRNIFQHFTIYWQRQGVANGVQGSGRPGPDRHPSGPNRAGDQA
jgi:hypothetical protein